MIINAGTNNFTKKRQSPEETAEEIIEIVKTCLHGGVKDIFVSSITCRPSYQTQINQVNKLLQYYAGAYNYKFIDNACIRSAHLQRDGVHLNKEGICILAKNFLAHINVNSVTFIESIWD